MKGYYFITDTGLSRAGNVKDVRRALTAEVGIVQYRAKETGTRVMLAEAQELKSLCQGAIFIVNDRVDVALAVDADGVHLGQEDMPYETARRLLGPDKIIGITVSTLAEARTAARQGADYLGVSPIFFTRTKPDAGLPAGLTLLQEIRNSVSLPLAAIGGITHENAAQVIAAGADMICAISQVVTHPDVCVAVEKFQKLFAGE
jgi:thiamine-phosphate pyrophosphorylase